MGFNSGFKGLKPRDEMDRTCNAHGGRVMNVTFWSGNLKEKDSFEELGIGGRNIVCLG